MDVAEAQKLIFANQHPTDCSSRKALVFHFDRCRRIVESEIFLTFLKAYFGLAVNVHFLSVALVYGLMHNRVVVTRNPDHWNYAG